MKHVILAGFDRCGSSMMAGLLAHHPDISMMFQPTNGTEVHQDMLRPWISWEHHPKTRSFFQTLLDGKVDISFVERDVFFKHSECLDYDTAALNVIKETKCCMKIDWLRYNFPDIALYGIWRKPEEIMYSLVKNNFHMDWYGQKAFDQILFLIMMSQGLERKTRFGEYVFEAKNKIQMMSIVLGVSLYYLKGEIRGKWLNYHDVVESPNILNGFVTDFGLDSFDFSEYIKHDFNVSGNDFEDNETWETYFNAEDKAFFARIFKELR